MHKSNILIAALLTGAFASENPFVIEKNIQKIEQEESLLLQALAKEQKRLEREEDKLFEEDKISDIKPEVSNVPTETEIVEEIESEESKPKEVAPPKEETKDPITIREVTGKIELEKANRPEAGKVQALVKKQSEKADAETKKSEEELVASKAEPAIVDEATVQSAEEANDSAEKNTTFEQKLKEAIRSVQD